MAKINVQYLEQVRISIPRSIAQGRLEDFILVDGSTRANPHNWEMVYVGYTHGCGSFEIKVSYPHKAEYTFYVDIPVRVKLEELAAHKSMSVMDMPEKLKLLWGREDRATAWMDE